MDKEVSDQYNVCKAVVSGDLRQVLQLLGSGNAELLAEGFPDTKGTVCDDLVADLALGKGGSQELCDLRSRTSSPCSCAIRG